METDYEILNHIHHIHQNSYNILSNNDCQHLDIYSAYRRKKNNMKADGHHASRLTQRKKVIRDNAED